MHRILSLTLLASATILADDEPVPFELAAPDGWRGEMIQLPPDFAKDMTLKGAEKIRFTPGMMKAGSDTFFCYSPAFRPNPTTRKS